MEKRVIMAKGEKFLIFMIIIIGVLFLVGKSISMAYLSRTNIEVESMRKKIKSQESLNVSLSMKINELASLDKVESVASLYGLEYNNNNIRVIEND